MSKSLLSAAEKNEIFSHQRDNGPFSALALETACLNYLDRLNRIFHKIPWQLQRTAGQPSKRGWPWNKSFLSISATKRRSAILTAISAIRRNNISACGKIYVDAVNFTFKRHRFRFVLDLLRLYSEDPCQILPERDIFKEKWEQVLLYDYLLLDMGQKNTEDIGREAVSNGYHECDYTLEIEEVWKQPMKAVPRSHFRYVKAALPYSQGARAITTWMKDHANDLAPALWVVDTQAIEALRQGPDLTVTNEDIAIIEKTF